VSLGLSVFGSFGEQGAGGVPGTVMGEKLVFVRLIDILAESVVRREI
jgi:hypothetical protein